MAARFSVFRHRGAGALAALALVAAGAALVAVGGSPSRPADGSTAASTAYEQARRARGLTGEAVDPELAHRRTVQAAELGHVDAQADLGFAHWNGSAEAPRDLALSLAWFTRAAEGGSVAARCMLGDFHRDGLGGTPIDHARAVSWYERSATAGHRCSARSQLALSVAHERGQGVARDEAAAVAWLRRAADAGLPDAQRALARRHDEGRGVERDPALATAWRKRSREGVSWHEDHDEAGHTHDGRPCPEHGAAPPPAFATAIRFR